MTEEGPGIIVVDRPVSRTDLKKLIEAYFLDMVKYVVDVRKRIVAVGGELHADAEQLLLDQGSRQQDLWGANYYPGRGPDRCIEYTALINIRPSQGNRAMEIKDEKLQKVVRDITFELIGNGEAL